MLQNAQMALDFLRYKKIKLVNIRAEDIVDGNPKLTLGLIWTIILHFQVSSSRVDLFSKSEQKHLQMLSLRAAVYHMYVHLYVGCQLLPQKSGSCSILVILVSSNTFDRARTHNILQDFRFLNLLITSWHSGNSQIGM